MIAEEFEYFEEKYGKPTTFIPADPAALSRLSTHLPEALIEYWEKFGFSTFLDGYYQLVNPEIYAPALADWIAGTELEKRDTYHVVAKTALGELFIWGEENGHDFNLSVLSDAMDLNKRNNSPEIKKDEANKWAESILFRLGYDDSDLHVSLFKEIKKLLGPVDPDKMYGLVPAIPLGGQIAAENFHIVSAPDHLAMLAQISERPVLTFDDIVRRAYGEAGVNVVNKQL